MRSKIVYVGLVVSGSAGLAAGDLIYDNGPGQADIDGGFNVTESNSVSNLADDAQVMVSATVSAIEWFGGYVAGSSVDDFRIDVFQDASGLPSNMPLASFDVGGNVTRTDVGQQLFGFDVLMFSASVSFDVVAGETYWISIVDQRDIPPFNSDRFLWLSQNGSGVTAFRDLGEDWQSSNTEVNFAYRLTGNVVPAPGAIAMACVGLGFIRRR